MKALLRVWSVVLAVGLIFLGYQQVRADSYSSSNYKLNGVVGNSTGGSNTSTNYKLESSSGESVIGNGSGGSYKLGYGYVSQLENSLSLTLQPTGLIVYAPLDQALTDQMLVTNGANSTIANMHSNGGASQVTGKVGNAAQFNGTSQYIDDQPSDASAYNPVTNTAGTIEFWFKSPSAGATDQFLVSREANCLGWETTITTTGKIHSVIATSPSGCGSVTYTVADSPLSYANNAWHHVAVTINRSTSTIKLYVDGQMVSSANTIPASDPAANGTLKVGADYANTRFLNGSVDELKIFTRDLRSDEIKAEYDASSAGLSSGLSFGTIASGVSNSVYADAVMQTDASRYSLAVNQNNNLTSGGNTITPMSGSIASPLAWSEGTTKGLGFSLSSGPNLDGKWGSGANYAALPNGATTFYSRAGSSMSAKDVVTMRLRLDVTGVQPSGAYTNTMTVTGTITP